MINSDRRRVALAATFTLVALPALWVLNRDDPSPGTTASAGIPSPGNGADTAPSTTAYEPLPPVFVGGDDEPTPPGVIDIAVPPGPSANEIQARASFSHYWSGGRPCTTLLAPDGATLTIVNVDNGQTTTCTNTLGKAVPAGADIVLDTPIYNEIASLADAPIPVRISW